MIAKNFIRRFAPILDMCLVNHMFKKGVQSIPQMSNLGSYEEEEPLPKENGIFKWKLALSYAKAEK